MSDIDLMDLAFILYTCTGVLTAMMANVEISYKDGSEVSGVWLFIATGIVMGVCVLAWPVLWMLAGRR